MRNWLRGDDMELREYDKGLFIKNATDFEPEHIFECGQCFRWNKYENGYIGVVSGRVAFVYKKDGDVYIEGGKKEDEDYWRKYFDLDRDYGKIKERLREDEILKEAVEHGYGIRLLNQEPFETLISFIISANNRIPMIKKAVDNISKRFGKKIIFKDMEFYSFPRIEELKEASIDELEECGTGFRAVYIYEAVKRIYEENIRLDEIVTLDTDAAQEKLLQFKGVGPKVADCVLLFSMQKYDAFPVDVWVKRIMQRFYLAPDVSLKRIREFGRQRFGDLAGFAQQYLFYYAREKRV